MDLPLLPLRDVVVFPHMVIPLFVGRPKSIKALEAAMEAERRIMLVAQKAAAKDEPSVSDMFEVGCISTILQMLKLPDGTVKVLVEGQQRARVTKITDGNAHFVANVVPVDAGDVDGKSAEIEALRRAVLQQFDQYVKLNKKIPPEILTSIASIDDPGRLADTIAAHLPLKLENKQVVLDLAEVKERLENLFEQIEREVEILNVDKRIRGRVKRQMEKNQRDFYLNEQVKAIQKELGEGEEGADIEEIEKKIKAAKMPKDAKKKADAELKKLKLMSPMSAEATVVRNYIDVLTGLPWAKKTKVKHDLAYAEEVLNEDHYGLEKVKDRILEYLAVQQRVDKVKAPILCLVGPPGVGKTSLGQSIARATGRKYVRQALGGMRDEAEIRGHRRTYIGAMPGKVLQSLSKVGTRNPLFLLDEIDKLGQDFRGDPASALLEVLDPEQNHTFSDHYVEVDFDLSDVMFVATSNTMNIPPALLDRMEVIRLSGYTEDEKTAIAMRYLLPKQMKNNGVKDEELDVTEDAVRDIVRYYTREDLPQDRQGPAAEEDDAQGRRHAGEPQRLPGRAQAHLRACGTAEPGRPGGRPRVDGSRRRPADDRSGADAGQGQRPAHRFARRRDEGVGRGRAHRGSQPRALARDQGRTVREEGHPHPRARWRDAEGRPVRRCRDDDGDGVGPHRHPRARRCRHDRRDHAARRSHRDRRPEGEAARGTARRHQDGADPGGEHQGPAGHPREREEPSRDRPGQVDRQGAGSGARTPAHAPGRRGGTACGAGEGSDDATRGEALTTFFRAPSGALSKSAIILASTRE
jgi:Lon protease-like protein/MoxR-like ATPase